METNEPSASDFGPQPSGSSSFGNGSANRGKADLGKRAIAMIIDSLVAAVLGVVPYIGGLAGIAYFLVRDGLEIDFMDQRSFGKKIVGLRPVRLDGRPMDIETSVRRNWMWGIGAVTSLLLYIPILGWALIPFVMLAAVAIGLYEVYNVVTDPEGRRWGDTLAATKVIEVQQ